ncbi:hypothetical protein [Streptomyces erythrochromogenes]|uniref:hypothetical protein n=1 Tax=Streptomyces erythrochromogenes TaxID=285574 RepID=UPI0037D62173
MNGIRIRRLAVLTGSITLATGVFSLSSSASAAPAPVHRAGALSLTAPADSPDPVRDRPEAGDGLWTKPLKSMKKTRPMPSMRHMTKKSMQKANPMPKVPAPAPAPEPCNAQGGCQGVPGAPAPAPDPCNAQGGCQGLPQ